MPLWKHPQGRWLLGVIALVTAAFGSAWLVLAIDAIQGKELHAYAAAIPFICAWLYWQRRTEDDAAAKDPRRLRPIAVVLWLAAVVVGIAGARARQLGSLTVSGDELRDASSLASKLKSAVDPVSAYIQGRLRATTRSELNAWEPPARPSSDIQLALVQDLNAILEGDSIWDASRFAVVVLREETRTLLESRPTGAELVRLNKLLLEDAYPLELSRNRRPGIITNTNSWLASQMLGWVLAVWGALLWFCPPRGLAQHAFAVGFLVFTIPLPQPLVDSLELFLQQASAETVAWTFSLAGVPYLRDGQNFLLPGQPFVVAKECSGIRSSLVLFITSLLGGQLLLRAAWRKATLALVVIPLGIARNTLRICTITLLTVYVDDRVINSPIHHKGGPFFFAVSLIPLFALLWWFRRQER